MVACLIYILYGGITRAFNWVLLLAIAAILIEGIVLMLNKWQCPLTTLAEKHGAESGAITGMFLPECIARNMFTISFILFPAELALLAFRYFTGI